MPILKYNDGTTDYQVTKVIVKGRRVNQDPQYADIIGQTPNETNNVIYQSKTTEIFNPTITPIGSYTIGVLAPAVYLQSVTNDVYTWQIQNTNQYDADLYINGTYKSTIDAGRTIQRSTNSSNDIFKFKIGDVISDEATPITSKKIYVYKNAIAPLMNSVYIYRDSPTTSTKLYNSGYSFRMGSVVYPAAKTNNLGYMPSTEGWEYYSDVNCYVNPTIPITVSRDSSNSFGTLEASFAWPPSIDITTLATKANCTVNNITDITVLAHITYTVVSYNAQGVGTVTTTREDINIAPHSSRGRNILVPSAIASADITCSATFEYPHGYITPENTKTVTISGDAGSGGEVPLT